MINECVYSTSTTVYTQKQSSCVTLNYTVVSCLFLYCLWLAVAVTLAMSYSKYGMTANSGDNSNTNDEWNFAFRG